MDYEKIAQVAQAACAKAIHSAAFRRDGSEEAQAQVFTSGIVDALREYDRQKEE